MENFQVFPDTKVKCVTTKQQTSIGALNYNKNKNNKKKLKKALEKVHLENESLNQLINQKNLEIANLKQSSESLNEIITTVPLDNVHYGPVAANYKLIEMSNENRKLNIELVATKSQLTKKELQIQKNQIDLQTLEARLRRTERIDISRSNLTDLKKQIAELNEVVVNLRQENADLQFRLNASLHCLQIETGHNWKIEEFIANPTNWIGRAEKIKNLEQEIEQYNEQIDSYKQLLSIDSARSANIQNTEENNEPIVMLDSFGLEKLKLLEHENLTLSSTIEKQKSQILNLRVRNEHLSEEVIKCRTLIGSLEQRANFNNEHFSSLSELIVQQQNDYDTRVGQLNSQIDDLKLQLDQANNHKQTITSKLNIVETMLSEKYHCIEKLLATNKKLESDLKSFCGGFLFACRDLRKEEFVAVLEALEAEKESLLKKLKVQEDKFNQFSARYEHSKEENKELRIKISHLECQLENLSRKSGENKKGTLERVVKYANCLKGPLQCDEIKLKDKKLTESEMLDTENEIIFNLKIKLQLAETTINELMQKITSLENEQKEHSKIFENMVTKSKDIILETIRKYRICSN